MVVQKLHFQNILETFSVDRYMSRCKTELNVKYKIKNSSVNSGH
jgi:hypothetical protein